MTQAKLIISLIVTVVMTLLIVLGGQTVMSWRDAAKQNEVRGGTLQATSGILQDSEKATTQRVQVEVGVTGAKQAFKDAIEEAKTHEPETTARAERPVPDSVRRAYRERRLARERLGRAGLEREARAAGADAPER